MQKLHKKIAENALSKVLSQITSSEQDLFAQSCLASIPGTKQSLPDISEYTNLVDMALAYGVRWLCNSDPADGKTLARITQKLIAAEAASGGPYAGSHGVDPGLNANIAWMLHMQGIQLSGLQEYIEQCIFRQEYASAYYLEQCIVKYLLSRVKLSEHARAILAEQIEVEVALSDDFLHNACAANILLRCNPESLVIEKLIPMLCQNIQDGLEEMSALAICAETLHLYIHAKNIDREAIRYRAMLQENIESFIARQPAYLASQISQLLPMIIAKDTNGEICMMAYESAALLPQQQRMSLQERARLGFASLLGWATYWVYDEIMDEQQHIALLPAAHACIREVQAIYTEFGFEEQATAIMNGMENANALEFGKRVALEELDSASLADRSMGHALAVLIQLHKAGYAEDSKEYQAVHSWFRNYILAKQLHDDAHDWEEDLLRGTSTQPVQMVLARAHTLGYSLEDREAIIRASRNYFISHCMAIIAAQILLYLRQAESALQSAPELHSEPLMKYIIPLRSGANRAMQQSKEMHTFLHTMDLQLALS